MDTAFLEYLNSSEAISSSTMSLANRAAERPREADRSWRIRKGGGDELPITFRASTYCLCGSSTKFETLNNHSFSISVVWKRAMQVKASDFFTCNCRIRIFLTVLAPSWKATYWERFFEYELRNYSPELLFFLHSMYIYISMFSSFFTSVLAWWLHWPSSFQFHLNKSVILSLPHFNHLIPIRIIPCKRN